MFSTSFSLAEIIDGCGSTCYVDEGREMGTCLTMEQCKEVVDVVRSWRASRVLEYVHVEICGPMVTLLLGAR